jgi:hypothetical protein
MKTRLTKTRRKMKTARVKPRATMPKAIQKIVTITMHRAVVRSNQRR